MPWRRLPIAPAEPCTTPRRFRNWTPSSIVLTASFGRSIGWDTILSRGRRKARIARLRSASKGTTRCAIENPTIVAGWENKRGVFLKKGKKFSKRGGGRGVEEGAA